MEKLILNCETITPMFCYGADQKKPAIRAASIKGALRFWWRALHGNLASNNINDMRKKEMEIFGGSGTSNSEAQRSKIVVRVKNVPNYNNKIKYSPVPHKQNGNAFPQQCFPAGTKFNIQLNLNRNISFKDGVTFNYNSLKYLFILFSILGGIGKRSRRGFGSFRILQINEEPFTKDINKNNIKTWVNSINNKFEWNQNHSNLKYPYLKDIHLGETGEYEDLLKHIGKTSHQNNSDYTGFAKGKMRLSSPVYVSVFDNSNYNQTIISELNEAFPEKWSPKGSQTDRKNFISELGGTS